MDAQLPQPPNPFMPHGHPPGAEVACCMCRNTVPAATAYTPYVGWHICGACLPAYRSLYPRQFRMPFFREFSRLLIAKNSVLPERCVVCGEPGNHRRRKMLTWHEPWLVLLIFAGILVYLLVAILVSKTGALDYALCRRHLVRRRVNFAVAVGLGFLVPLGLLFYAVALPGGVPQGMGISLFMVGLVSAFAGIIWGVATLHDLKVAKIDDQYIHLKSLPPALEAELHELASRTPVMIPWAVPAPQAALQPHAIPAAPPRMS